MKSFVVILAVTFTLPQVANCQTISNLYLTGGTVYLGTLDNSIDGDISDTVIGGLGIKSSGTDPSPYLHGNFDQSYTITEFTIHNDIQVVDASVGDFEIIFYSDVNQAGANLGVYTNSGTLAKTEQNFSIAEISGARSFSLELIDSLGTHNPYTDGNTYYNYREITFTGTAVPESSSLSLFGLAVCCLTTRRTR